MASIRSACFVKRLKGATGDWEIVIGTGSPCPGDLKSKLFSGASTEFGAEPNANVSLVDAAMPGMLPVINEECVAQACAPALASRRRSTTARVFDRKNYFYPDLPQGYQISQFKEPIVGEGEIADLDGPDDGSRTKRSASSGCTWSRTPASRCTTSTRRCPTSTSTAPAWR
jgi:aspartyl-tRNA(Asn)/glutamyl-tRNA(Gln) amidotransferase subunit B